MIINYLKSLFTKIKGIAYSQLIIASLLLYQVSIVSRGLGLEDYGRVGLVTVFTMTVFRVLHSKNSDVTLMILNNKNHSVFIHSIFFDLFIGFVGYIICILIINSSLNNYIGSFNLNTYLNLFLISKIIQTISETTKAHLIYQGDYKKLAFYESLPVVVRFAFIFVLFLFEPSINNYLISYSIYSFMYGLYGIFIFRNHLTLENLSSYNFLSYFNDIKLIFFKQRADQLTGIIPQNLDIIILGYFTDYASVGIYRIAKRLAEPINLIVNSLVPYVQNNLSHKNEKFEISNLIKYLLLPISFIIFLFYYFLGKSVINIISGEEFLAAYEPLIFILFGFLIYLNTFWIRQELLFNNKIQYHVYGRLINTATFLIIVSIFIKNYGVTGLAIALSISVLVQKMYEYFIYKKILSI
tara:strand:+ start:52 stop:1284 length:1233 start_codon:yes stop_codon:yes gene_type:complete